MGSRFYKWWRTEAIREETNEHRRNHDTSDKIKTLPEIKDPRLGARTIGIQKPSQGPVSVFEYIDPVTRKCSDCSRDLYDSNKECCDNWCKSADLWYNMYSCMYPGCKRNETKPFSRKEDVYRHLKHVHGLYRNAARSEDKARPQDRVSVPVMSNEAVLDWDTLPALVASAKYIKKPLNHIEHLRLTPYLELSSPPVLDYVPRVHKRDNEQEKRSLDEPQPGRSEKREGIAKRPAFDAWHDDFEIWTVNQTVEGIHTLESEGQDRRSAKGVKYVEKREQGGPKDKTSDGCQERTNQNQEHNVQDGKEEGDRNEQEREEAGYTVDGLHLHGDVWSLKQIESLTKANAKAATLALHALADGLGEELDALVHYRSIGRQETRISQASSQESQQWTFELLEERLRSIDPTLLDPAVSRKILAAKYKKFQQKAAEAFQKLSQATADIQRSTEFRTFVRKLGSVGNVIDIGCRGLYDFLDKKPPDDIQSIYCLLHVSYAMGTSSCTHEVPRFTDGEFAESATEFKACLSNSDGDEVDYAGNLFDELVEVMWAELREGMEFLDRLNFEDAQEAPYTQWDLQEACETLVPPKGFDLANVDLLAMWDMDSEEYPEGYLDAIGSGSGDGATIDPRYLYTDLIDIPPDIESMLRYPSYNQSLHLPPEPGVDPPAHKHLPAPTLGRLNGELIIKTTCDFLEGLFETGIMFLQLCRSLSPILIRPAEGLLNPTTIPITTRDRAKVIEHFKQDIGDMSNLGRIVSATSEAFVRGAITTLEELEEATISLLKLFCPPKARYESLASLVITSFNCYYWTCLPDSLKCPQDRYREKGYIQKRIDEEYEWHMTDTSTPSLISSTSPESITSTPISKKRGRSESEDPSTTRPAVSKKNKRKNTGGLKIVEYNPNKKRGKVLANLPKAVYTV